MIAIVRSIRITSSKSVASAAVMIQSHSEIYWLDDCSGSVRDLSHADRGRRDIPLEQYANMKRDHEFNFTISQLHFIFLQLNVHDCKGLIFCTA